MTEKEKAEEYCKNSKDFVKYTSETYKSRLKKAYLDGLAEGKKEKCLEQNIDGTIRPCEVMKENTELKELHKSDKESLQLIIDKTNEQIEQLSNDNHVLKTSFICQKEQIEKLEKENAELKKQNKKLNDFDNSQSKKLLIKIESMKLDIQALKNTFDYFPINSAINQIFERWEKK